MFQVYSIVIHSQLSLHSIYSYYKIFARVPVLDNISLHLILYLVVCTSSSITSLPSFPVFTGNHQFALSVSVSFLLHSLVGHVF